MQQRKLVRACVDPDLCVGSAMCVSASPGSFRMGSDGHAIYVADAVDEASALDTAELCPVSTIQLIYEE
ncbi:MAG TPA: ferredoxin [Steroidobacteraceae bacterium]|jgi:ferredoxin|nr:ferredoxin [Steroidobacteraceae bacterium]